MTNNDITIEPKKKKLSFKFILHKIGHYFSNPSNVILLIFGIFLTLAVIYPIINMILDTFQVLNSGIKKALNEEFNKSLQKGDWTLLNWPYIMFNKTTQGFSEGYFWKPMGKSILMSLVACGIAVISGGVLAFLITRTNLPFKKFISTVFIFPYIMPSWSIAIFWENFFKTKAIPACPGNGLLVSLLGINAPEWLIYGFWPCAFVLGIHYAPFAYILIGGILRNMDANLEEAATILKASRFKILRRITLPIVAPAMISTILLVFASSISSYTVPATLASNSSYTAIAVTMRSFLSTKDNLASGYVIATVLMAMSILILSLNNWFTKSRRSFTTVSGKSGQISKINLGKVGKWIIASVVVILVTFFAIVPLITFILESLEGTSGDISTITLDYWLSPEELGDEFVRARGYATSGVIHNKTILNSFGRSIITAVAVALFAGTFGILIGYAVSRNRRSKWANYVSSLAFLPYLIPALCFSSIFLSISKTDSFHFLDVMTTQNELSAVMICIICGSVKFLPFASRSGTNAMLQVSGEIEEAAIITGCPWGKRMTRILFPIQKSSFISGYLLPFISAMREYSLFALITSPVTLTTNVLEYYSRNGVDQLANALNLLLVVFVILVNLLVNWLTGASIDKGIGG